VQIFVQIYQNLSISRKSRSQARKMSKSARTSASTPPLRVGWLARCLCSASTSNTQLYSVPGRVLIVLTVPSDIWRSSVNNNVVKNSVDSSDDFLTVGACMWGCLNGLKEGNDNRRRFTTPALFARCRSHQLTVPMTCAKSNCLSIFFRRKSDATARNVRLTLPAEFLLQLR